MAEPEGRVDCCATDFILSCPFHRLTVQEKSELIKKGRPMPEISLHTVNKHGRRHFHMELYDKYLFLTASCKLNKLFCWPCLLFMNKKSILGRSGFSDLNNLYTHMTIHTSSEKHLHCVLELGSFGSARVEVASHDCHDVKRHNERVERNKNILRRLIDTTIFLGKQGMSFSGNGEESGSSDNGNFMESLLFLSSYDSLIKTHLDSSTSDIFSTLSNSIQNDLISSVTEVTLAAIRSHISKSPFVSITIDAFLDINNCERITTILRYCANDNVEERFVGFEDASDVSRTREVLSEHVFAVLDKFGCLEKLVAQTYNGASVLPSELYRGQEKVRQKCPMAMFVPSSDQTLNQLLSLCVEKIGRCKAFFGHVNGLVNFFNASTRRSALLAKTINDNLKNGSWEYRSLDVNIIFAHKQSIVDSFECIQNDASLWDDGSLSFVDVYSDKLQEFEFNIYLNMFSKIFMQAEIIFKVIKSETVNRGSSLKNIQNFKAWLTEEFAQSFDSLYSDALKSSEPPRKKRRHAGDDREHYNEIFKGVAWSMISQLKDRFKYLEKFKFFELLDPKHYDSYYRAFPDPLFLCLQQGFPDAFDWNMLKNELKAIYSSVTFRNCNASNLYEFLRTSKTIISDSFSQVFRLCKLLLTIPSHPSTDGASCSVLKRVETYCRSTQNQHRFSELAIMAVEKDLLLKLKRGPTFYDDVLKRLAKKETRLDLEYK